MKIHRDTPCAFLLLTSLLFAAGCGKSGGGGGFSIGGLGRSGGLIDATAKTIGAGVKASEEFDARDEYLIGRSAAAQLVHQYPLYRDDTANRYVNQVGQALAEFSDMPEVYSGYHFHILDSNDINAFSTPGAFIFITRGMLRCAATEDELAAILAHEIGHVQNNHAIKAIKQARGTEFWTTAAVSFGGAAAGGGNYAEAAKFFGGTMKDMTTTLVVNGYSRDLETQADTDGVEILRRTGYNPHAMVSMLEKMKTRIKPGGADFAKTHPKPQDRIAVARQRIGAIVAITADPARQQRFDAALKQARAE